MAMHWASLAVSRDWNSGGGKQTFFSSRVIAGLASLEHADTDVQTADGMRSRRWLTEGSAIGVDSRKNGGRRTCQREQKSVVVAGWRQARLRSHLESVVRCRGLCGPLGRHSSSSSSARATPTTRAEPVYCASSLRPLSMACADITQGMPFVLPLVIATGGQCAAGIHKSPGLCRGGQASS